MYYKLFVVLAGVRRKAAYLDRAESARFALWSRGAATAALARHPDVSLFGPADVVGDDSL